MEKSVKQIACAHCQKKIDLILYRLKSPTSNDYFLVCENCYNELKPTVYNEDDRYYQYIEDHQQMEKRLEEELNEQG